MKNARAGRRIHIEKGSRNVYADLHYPDSEDMLVKAQLVTQIADIIRRRGLTQQKAEKLLRLTQPTLTKNRPLTTFIMNTYEKTQGGGGTPATVSCQSILFSLFYEESTQNAPKSQRHRVSANKSGRLRRVFSRAMRCRQRRISSWLPPMSISGTGQPRNSAGRV